MDGLSRQLSADRHQETESSSSVVTFQQSVDQVEAAKLALHQSCHQRTHAMFSIGNIAWVGRGAWSDPNNRKLLNSFLVVLPLTLTPQLSRLYRYYSWANSSTSGGSSASGVVSMPPESWLEHIDPEIGVAGQWRKWLWLIICGSGGEGSSAAALFFTLFYLGASLGTNTHMLFILSCFLAALDQFTISMDRLEIITQPRRARRLGYIGYLDLCSAGNLAGWCQMREFVHTACKLTITRSSFIINMVAVSLIGLGSTLFLSKKAATSLLEERTGTSGQYELVSVFCLTL